MNVVFTAAENEILIEEVQREPALFDAAHSKYKDIVHKDILWQNISDTVGRGVDETKKRWKNIRDSYSRSNRKLRTGLSKSKNKQWTLASRLSFLQHMETKRVCVSKSRTTPQSDDVAEIKVEDVSELNIYDVYNETQSKSSSDYFEPAQIDDDQLKKNVPKRQSKTSNNHSKSTSSHSRALSESFMSRTETIINEESPNDIDLFCQSLAASMKKLPKKGVNEAKLQLLTVLNGIEEKYSTEYLN